MKSSSFEQAIQAQFDCLTKKVIKRAAMKYNRDIARRLKHEVPFSEISDLELNKAGVYDKYSSDYTAFNVLGMEVQISDDQLSKALKCLPERKRNIILLSYFMDMSDAEIGELMNVYFCWDVIPLMIIISLLCTNPSKRAIGSFM